MASDQPLSVQIRDTAWNQWRRSCQLEIEYDPANAIHILGRINGPLNTHLLAQALNALADRHRMLRATIQTHGGIPHFKINDQVKFDLLNFEVGDQAPHQIREADVEQHIFKLVWTPFEFDPATGNSGQLLRAFIIKYSDEQWILGLVMHHSVADAASIGVLACELSRLYGRLLKGLDVQPRQKFDFFRYAAELEDKRASPEILRQREEIEAKIQEAPTFQLAPDLDGSDPVHNASVSLPVPDELAKALREFARQNDLTLDLVLFASQFLATARATGMRRGQINVTHFGRPSIALYKEVGCFTANGPVFLEMADHESVEGWLKAAKKAYTSAVNWQGGGVFSFENDKVVSFPFFNFMDISTSFFQGGLFANFAMVPAPNWPVYDERLSYYVRVSGIDGSYTLSLSYRADLYSQEKMSRFLQNIVASAELILNSSGKSVAQLLS